MIFEDRGIQGEACEGHREQSGADETQPRVRHHAKKREQGKAFKGPAERDPFALELEREDEAEEEQRRAALPGKTRVARSGNDSAFLDQVENADGERQDEKRGQESMAPTGLGGDDQVVDKEEMEPARDGADRPRERGVFLPGEEWVGDEEETEDHIPGERHRWMCRREVLRVPRAFQRPGEGESDGRNPTAARENAEPEQDRAQDQRHREDRGRLGHGQFPHDHEQEDEGHRRGQRGNVPAFVVSPNASFRTSKVAAVEKKIPNPPTTVRIPLMLSCTGGAVTTHRPAVTSVATSATKSARTEADDHASAIATRSISNTHAQTAKDVSPFQTQMNRSTSASSGMNPCQDVLAGFPASGRFGQTVKPEWMSAKMT